MYESFYGFREKPFHVTSDPAFLYPSPQHREALDHLLYGIREQLGFILILGEVGTGKTTLAKALVNRLNGPVKTALILHPTLSPTQILLAILREFLGPQENPAQNDQRSPSPSRGKLLTAIEQLLLQQAQRQATTVLILDEAQALSAAALEQVRLLSNVETSKQKLLQIVLIGQPELGQRLATEHRLRAVQQRIAVRYQLQPLDETEVAAYIQHRLHLAGSQGKPHFTEGALAAIARASGGIPRRINLLCDQALLAGFVHESERIDESMVAQALAVVSTEPVVPETMTERNYS